MRSSPQPCGRAPAEERARRLENRWSALSIFLLALLFYGLQAERLVGKGDPAEFVIASRMLGITHPPGYPIYIALGHLFSLVPIGSIAARVHFTSALWAALALAVFHHFLLRVLQAGGARRAAHGVGLVVAILLATTQPVWSEATIAEVYTLKLLFSALLLWLFARYFEGGSERVLLAAALVFGLSFGAHLSFVFLLPFLLPFAWSGIRRSPMLLLKCVGLVFVGGLQYVILYLRGLAVPEYVNSQASFFAPGAERGWSSIQAYSNFILGGTWREVRTESAAEFLERASTLASAVVGEYGWAALVLGASGVWIGLSRAGIPRRVVLLLLAVMGGEFAFFGYYPVATPSMSLPVFACACMLMGIGIMGTVVALSERLGWKGKARAVGLSLLSAVALVPALQKVPPDHEKHGIAARWVASLIESLPEGSRLRGLSWAERRTLIYYELVEGMHIPFRALRGNVPSSGELIHGTGYVAWTGPLGEWEGYPVEPYLSVEGAPTIYRLLPIPDPE